MNNRKLKLEVVSPTSIKCGYIQWLSLDTKLVGKTKALIEENERLNNIIKNLDKMFEYYFLGNLKYDQDTVNTIYIKYVKLKELKDK